MDYRLTLCIPTNGVLEWCVPVINSIYNQGIAENQFQVVVADNGDNMDFRSKMLEYADCHSNFVYKKTAAEGFLNQIECFKLAEGKLIKFINHRMCLLPGALERLLDCVERYDEDAVLYFSNGALRKKRAYSVESFDAFMYELSYWSSWSAGLAFWKNDLKEINKIDDFNSLFPHTDILFLRKDASEYVLVDEPLMKEIRIDDTKKGHYNLFRAFAEEYLNLIEQLYHDGAISNRTYRKIYNGLKHFLGSLYGIYVVGKTPCSYDLTDANRYIENNFSISEIKRIAYLTLLKEKMLNCVRKLIGRV